MYSGASAAQQLADTACGWGESAGWVTVVSSGPDASLGHDGFLSGYLRGESVGWIHLGDGAPADGVQYSNASADDYGVNRNGFLLSGFAWGENIGWIDFAPLLGYGMMLLPDGSLQGMAWSESCGWILFYKWGPTVEFLWQTVELPEEGAARCRYTVSVVSPTPPVSPSTTVLPMEPALEFARQPRQIIVRDEGGNQITEENLLRRVLALARNAAVYRNWQESPTDPLDVLGVLGGFSVVEETGPQEFCGLIEIDGQTDTSFGHDYPGHLSFHADYLGHGGDTRIVDWDRSDSLLCVLPFCYCDPFHPVGLKDSAQREKVYTEVLKHLIVQDAVDNLDAAAIEEFMVSLTVVARFLRDAEGLYDTADKLTTLAAATENGRKAFVAACKLVHFSRSEMVAISSGFAPDNFTGWFYATFPAAKTMAPYAKFASKVSGVLAWVGFVFDVIDIPGEVLHFYLQIASLQDHGQDILAALEDALARIGSGRIDPALWNALANVKVGLGEGVPLLLKEAMINLAGHTANATLDLVQIYLTGAAAAATGTIAGAPAGAVLFLADGAISVVRLGVGFVVDKLEAEELQQAVVLMSTIERSWWDEALSTEVAGIGGDVLQAESLDHLAWLVSTRLYIGAFVGARLLENNSGFINWIRSLLDKDFDAHRDEQEEFSQTMAQLMLGKGDPYDKTGGWLVQVAGRRVVTGPKYLGFCPAKAIDYLVALAKPRALENHSLTFAVRSTGGAGAPGGGAESPRNKGTLAVGITDPVGRRLGLFSAGDPIEVQEINEIAGATLSTDGEMRLSIPEPFDGDYKITAASDSETSYTVEVTRKVGETIVGTDVISSVVTPGRSEDAGAAISTETGSFEGTVTLPVWRSSVQGIVRRAGSLQPIDGASVSIGDSTKVAGPDGLYAFDDVPPGSYALRVIVALHRGFLSDSFTLAAGEDKEMNVELEALRAPVADPGGPYQGYVGRPLEFDASRSVAGTGTIRRYEWDFDGDGMDDAISVVPHASHTYGADFEGRVFIRVVDSDGLSGRAYAEVRITVRVDDSLRGDANASNAIDIADAIFMLSHLFAQGPAPSCKDAADANDDGKLDIADAISILSHLFASAGPLKPPFGACGIDPTEDMLDCVSFAPCEEP